MTKSKVKKLDVPGTSSGVEEEPGKFLVMQVEGREVPVVSHGTEEAPPTPELSPLEWEIIRLMENRKGTPFDSGEVARALGENEVSAAMETLQAAGMVDQKLGRYRITAKTSLQIPLTAEERGELEAAEARIDALVDDIQGKQLQVARELRTIRDKKLHRETHERFQDYVEERFYRTRDWAYKMIRDLEVMEALQGDGVEALLQTVTAREMPHLAKLKSEPAKMQEALQEAEQTAKAENRARTPDDVKKAVEVIKPPKAKEEAPPAPKVIRTITVKGIDFAGGEIDDLPAYFTAMARWLRDNQPDAAFTVKVSKPQEEAGSSKQEPESSDM